MKKKRKWRVREWLHVNTAKTTYITWCETHKVSKMKQTAPYTKQKFNWGGGACCVTNESYLEYEKQQKYFEEKLKYGGDHWWHIYKV